MPATSPRGGSVVPVLPREDAPGLEIRPRPRCGGKRPPMAQSRRNLPPATRVRRRSPAFQAARPDCLSMVEDACSWRTRRCSRMGVRWGEGPQGQRSGTYRDISRQ
jgi:hypothetical protein